MSKSPVEKLNDIKLKELKLKEEEAREERHTIKDNSPDAEVDSKTTFTDSPSSKSRRHKEGIGIDKEPGTV